LRASSNSDESKEGNKLLPTFKARLSERGAFGKREKTKANVGKAVKQCTPKANIVASISSEIDAKRHDNESRKANPKNRKTDHAIEGKKED